MLTGLPKADMGVLKILGTVYGVHKMDKVKVLLTGAL